jgi:hypothetical protein
MNNYNFAHRCLSLSAALAFVSLLSAGCGSSSNGNPGVDAGKPDAAKLDAAPGPDVPPGDAGMAGGPVPGAADMHCGTRKQETDQAACMPPAPDGGAADGGDEGDGGEGDAGEEPAAVLYNSEGDDDDCKYHVKFAVDPIYQKSDVFFRITVTRKADGMPAAGARVDLEVFLTPTHPSDITVEQRFVEGPAGTYQVGPFRFDASGKWTAKFHFYEECSDLDEASPHGHVSFFLNVF